MYVYTVCVLSIYTYICIFMSVCVCVDGYVCMHICLYIKKLIDFLKLTLIQCNQNHYCTYTHIYCVCRHYPMHFAYYLFSFCKSNYISLLIMITFNDSCLIISLSDNKKEAILKMLENVRLEEKKKLREG